MSLQKKYFYYFRDIDDLQYTAEIWEEAAGTITAVEIRGDAAPFTVTMPGLSDKFQPVRGSGCQINLVSETNMQFIGLYTADMQQYQIRLYASGSLVWIGWLDSELYSEPFNDLTNYPVSFSGSDGFALLDRMNYINDDGSKITGISSQIDVLKFILEKMNLPFAGITIYLSTEATGTTPTDEETLLHVTHIVNANYYNEDGEPETLRTVLESILQPYGAFITQVNGTLFITDVHTIAAGTSVTANRYDSLSLEYYDSVTFNPNKGDVSDIGFTSETQTLDIVSGVNKQIVSFSPYNLIDIMDYSADEDFTSPGLIETYGTAPYRWNLWQHSTSKVWDKFDAGKFIKIQGVEDPDFVDYFLQISKSFDYLDVNTKQFTYKGEMPLIIPAGYKLRLRMSGYFRRSTELEDPDFVPSVVSRGELYLRLAIGDKKIVNTAGSPTWVDISSTTSSFFLPFEKAPNPVSSGGMTVYYPIEDQWLSSGFYSRKEQVYTLYDQLIPLDSGFTNGMITLDLHGYICFNLLGAPTDVLDARFKDIQLTIVDSEGKDYKDIDLEYVGYMNALYKESGTDIRVLQGTNTDNFPTCRGGLLKYDGTDYSFLQEWTRASVSDIIENLLLRSYVGNYQGKTKQITCSINRLPQTVGYLTYDNYLTGKFMPTSFTHDFENASTELTMQEIFTDALTINKSF